jgi:hypothetical protein
LIAPHCGSGRSEDVTQYGRPPRRSTRRVTMKRTIAWFQNCRLLCVRWQEATMLFWGYLHFACSLNVLGEVLARPYYPCNMTSSVIPSQLSSYGPASCNLSRTVLCTMTSEPTSVIWSRAIGHSECTNARLRHSTWRGRPRLECVSTNAVVTTGFGRPNARELRWPAASPSVINTALSRTSGILASRIRNTRSDTAVPSLSSPQYTAIASAAHPASGCTDSTANCPAVNSLLCHALSCAAEMLHLHANSASSLAGIKA